MPFYPSTSYVMWSFLWYLTGTLAPITPSISLSPESYLPWINKSRAPHLPEKTIWECVLTGTMLSLVVLFPGQLASPMQKDILGREDFNNNNKAHGKLGQTICQAHYIHFLIHPCTKVGVLPLVFWEKTHAWGGQKISPESHGWHMTGPRF